MGQALVRLAGLARAAGRTRMAGLALACWLGTAQAGAPAQVCRCATPQPWPNAVANRWSGTCKAGQAQGRGVLRALRAGQLVQAFYGHYQAGQPMLGVVEVEGGFRAGRFGADGQVVADGDRNTAIRAFNEGAAAARALATSLRKARNAASARFYEAKARQLAEQLD